MNHYMEILKSGGFVMIPLILFSVISWTILFERLISLSLFRKNLRKIHPQIESLIAEKNWAQLKGILLSCPENLLPTYQTLIENREGSQLTARTSRKAAEVGQSLKRPLWILATIASSAPFIGLFGTVIGIIRSFEDIARQGKGGFSIVAAGLSEALVATAAGIVVAVFAVLFYNYLSTLVQKIIFEFKIYIEEALSLIKE